MSLMTPKVDRVALATTRTQNEDAETTLIQGLLNALSDFNGNISQINSMILLKQVKSLCFVWESKSCDQRKVNRLTLK